MKKYILGMRLPSTSRRIYAYKIENQLVPNWLTPFQTITAFVLYSRLLTELIYDITFSSYGPSGTDVIWNKTIGYEESHEIIHVFLYSYEWREFVRMSNMRSVENPESVNWIKEGF